MSNAELKNKLEALRDECMGKEYGDCAYDNEQSRALCHIMDAIDCLEPKK